MTHQCVACGKLYEEGAPEIEQGCSCAGKVFFWIKKERMNGTEEPFILTSSDREEIVQDVKDLVGNTVDHDKPIILDLESINVEAPGKYEIDLSKLLRKNAPVIFKVEEGRYVIDLSTTVAGKAAKVAKKKREKKRKRTDRAQRHARA